jgi:hypothetical protein
MKGRYIGIRFKVGNVLLQIATWHKKTPRIKVGSRGAITLVLKKLGYNSSKTNVHLKT